MAEAKRRGRLLVAPKRVGRKLAIALWAQIVAPLLIDVVAHCAALAGIDAFENFVDLQQVIAIARAVDLSGKVLILDEPTASLDSHEVAMLFDVVRSLKKRGLGIVFITHFLEQVYEISDRITVLRNGRLVGTHHTVELPRKQLISLMLGRELEQTEHLARMTSADAGEIRFRFSNFGKRGKIKPFDIDVKAGEVIGVAGLLGVVP